MKLSNPGMEKRRHRIGRRPANRKRLAEIVTTCDHCGRKLGRTCARTDGSYACALGDGIVGRMIDGKHHYFCSKACAEAFE